MSNYKLHKLNKKGRWFHANDTSFTDEYADERLDLFLRSSVVKKENGKYGNVYRLHAKEPHTVEMALDYDIGCPKCGAQLRLIGRCLNSHELGLYTCPVCDKR